MSTSAAQDREPRPEVLLGVAEWIGRRQGYVWRWLRYLGSDPHLAEDLAQETFVAALAHDVPARPDGVALAWLRTTARNLYRMHLRRARSRPGMRDLDELDAEFEVHAHPDLGETYRAALGQCLDLLDARSREALRLRYAEGASRDALAAALDLSPEGAKTLLRRVKEQLRRCIEKRRQA